MMICECGLFVLLRGLSKYLGGNFRNRPSCCLLKPLDENDRRCECIKCDSAAVVVIDRRCAQSCFASDRAAGPDAHRVVQRCNDQGHFFPSAEVEAVGFK